MSRSFAQFYKIKYFFSWLKVGIVFNHNGDTVVWIWPWKRENKPKYISIGFTGTGEFGEARYSSLKQLDNDWNSYWADMEAFAKEQSYSKDIFSDSEDL